jgi:hypothetical protein
VPLAARVRLAVLLLALPVLGAASCNSPIWLGLPTTGGVMPVEITLPAGVDPAAVVVALDEVDVTASFAPGGPGLVGTIPVPDPGPHRLSVTRPFASMPSVVTITNNLLFDAPSAAPAVLAVEPAPGGVVSSGAWLRFRLAERPDAAALAGFGFALECNGARVQRAAHALDDGSLILNPTPALPAGSACRATWRAAGGGVAETAFGVAAASGVIGARVLYDRADPLAIAPFPDDFWVVPDATQPSGKRVALPTPPFTDPAQLTAFTALAGLVGETDGWSRQTPIVIGLTDPLDASAVPADLFASQDPFAPIALVDVDPASPDFGRRVPYRLLARTDPRPASVGGGVDHSAILFPAVDLREQGRYALVVTRRAFAAGEPGRPFGPSALFAEVLTGPEPGESPTATAVRAVVGDALDVVAGLADVPIPGEDVALALSISIRTQPPVSDLVAVKEQALAAPPPSIVIPDVTTNPCPTPPAAGVLVPFCIRLIGNRAVEVRGRVQLPAYRNPATARFVRDPVTGEPVPNGVAEAPFVMTLPLAALDGPVHPVMYQHGNPGSPTELLGSSSEQIDDAGFALLGFQDTLNRELSPSGTTEQRITTQVLAIFANLLINQSMPEYWLQTGADQIHFLRVIQGLGSLDLIHAGPGGAPALGPDGQPEIDPSVILYKGISEGANNAQRFLPFAPEILAAEATVGGARLGETLIHQSADQILQQITNFLPQLKPLELWVGLSLFQAGFDPQDGHTYLRYLYREPLLPFAGSGDATPPSTIWTEGIGDSLVPNNATRAMVRELGIPHVRPVEVAVPDVEQVDAPLAGNVAPGITAGYFQFRPSNTPGCAAQPEGHYCPQSAPEARAQRLHFLLSALDGEAEIVDPF